MGVEVFACVMPTTAMPWQHARTRARSPVAKGQLARGVGDTYQPVSANQRASRRVAQPIVN